MKKLFLIALIILSIFFLIHIFFEIKSYKDFISNYNAKISYEFESIYDSAYKVFENSSKILYQGYITNDEIINILYKGMYLKEDEEGCRKLLKTKFDNIYEELKKVGFDQVHFHNSKGYSFLRMHRPDQYGDPLSDVRPIIDK